MACQAGIPDAPHARVGFQIVRHGQPIAVLALDAQSQRFEAAADQIGGLGVDDAAQNAVHLAQRGRQATVADNSTGHHIVVAGQVFGDAVDHQIDAVIQRAQV